MAGKKVHIIDASLENEHDYGAYYLDGYFPGLKGKLVMTQSRDTIDALITKREKDGSVAIRKEFEQWTGNGNLGQELQPVHNVAYDWDENKQIITTHLMFDTDAEVMADYEGEDLPRSKVVDFEVVEPTPRKKPSASIVQKWRTAYQNI